MYNSIFQQPWWLDTVAPGQWDAIEIRRGDEIVAKLPYVVKKRFGLTLLTHPSLTQTLGPWLRSSHAKYTKRLAEEKDLMTELIQRLPSFDYFCQNFHYCINNWLPFYWQGFEQTTRYTYVLEDLTNCQEIWNNFQENIRREIRKAQSRFQLQVRTDLDVNTFLDISKLTFERQGMTLPYPRELVRRLDAACVQRGARQIFFATDKHDRTHAAVYIVWDENSAYYLMGGGNPELRKSGATSLCMWEAIKFASAVTRKFDFEGSMIEPVERFFRAFGAVQKPYFQISKTNSRLMRLRSCIKSLIV